MSPYLLFFSLLLSLAACQKDTAPEPIISPPSSADEEPLSEPDTIRHLALGDSYTIGQSVSYSQRWPVQLAARLGAELPDTLYYVEEPAIIARTGWTTGGLQQAIASADTLKPPYDIVSLLIGVNNQYQNRPVEAYRTEFRELLEQAIAFAGGDPNRVAVLSIPDYAYTPFGQNWGDPEETSTEIDLYNDINRAISAEYGVGYFDITPISRRGLEQPELVAGDGLHPSGEMYALWVEEIVEYVLFVLQ